MQARADIEAATRIGGNACDPNMRAQVLAKAQQGVEKVMKAAIVILTHAGIVIRGIPGTPHTSMRAPITHHVWQFAEAISLLAAAGPRRRVPQAVQAVAGALSGARRNVIAHLDNLAPAVPPAGTLHLVNTEYPYEVTANDWIHPSDPNAFTAQRTKWAFDDAEQIVEDLDRIVAALEIAHP
jgi:hypothetical protein